MKNKVIYIALAIIFIVAIIMTVDKGLKVDTFYGEGYTISFTEKTEIELSDIESIVKEIWKDNYSIKKLEFFGDSAEIKVKDYNDEQINQLKDKLNEKYGSELEISSFDIEHVANIKLRTVITPYIIPTILSLLIVMMFYAIRYKGARKMLELLICLIAVEGVLYSVYAIARIPVSYLTMPIAMCLYTLVILAYTLKSEKEIYLSDSNN